MSIDSHLKIERLKRIRGRVRELNRKCRIRARLIVNNRILMEFDPIELIVSKGYEYRSAGRYFESNGFRNEDQIELRVCEGW